MTQESKTDADTELWKEFLFLYAQRILEDRQKNNLSEQEYEIQRIKVWAFIYFFPERKNIAGRKDINFSPYGLIILLADDARE